MNPEKEYDPLDADALPPPVQAAPRMRKRDRIALLLIGPLWLVLLVTATDFVPVCKAVIKNGGFRNLPPDLGLDSSIHSYKDKHKHKHGKHGKHGKLTCPTQPAALHPPQRIEWTDELRGSSIEKFQEAVRIPTQSYDDNGEPGEDERWAPFEDFKRWLADAFPTAWDAAHIEFINTLGILATFEGSDPSLKPLLLMSHYDVVPVPESTYDRWTYPPFSAEQADGYIWGRGAADDKTLLVAQWEAITYLLEHGFQPRRTLILSHGFDEEEVFARRGQGQIAPFLERRYGKDGLLMVIDEGGSGLDDWYGTPFAMPGMGEKGYLDIKISVGTNGGHSSVPPVHTGIGVMSQLVTALEDHPFESKLTPESPVLTQLMCGAAHAPSFPRKMTKALKKGPKGWDKVASTVAAENVYYKALVGTTIAVDVVDGGVKVNALPELTTALVNFRIDFSESIQSTQNHVTRVLRKVADKNGLKFSAWKNATHEELGGRFVALEVFGLPLEPAPNTPDHGGVWDVFAGTLKAVIPGKDGKERIVTPSASTGNTDCKMYYNLTKNVYRFSASGDAANIHTVDERASVQDHYQIVDFVHAIIQNADAYEGDE